MSLERHITLYLVLSLPETLCICLVIPSQLFTITTVTNQTCVATQVTMLKQTSGNA